MKVIVLEKYKELKELHENLRIKYIQVIEKKTDIIYKKVNYLEAKYLDHFGYLLKNKLTLSANIKRNKKEINLIQKYINRQEIIDFDTIQNILREDMELISEELNEYQQKIEYSKEIIKIPNLTEDESQRIKIIYRKLADKLHPDINEFVDLNAKEMWLQIQKSYQGNDLPVLLLLERIIDDNEYEREHNNGIKNIEEKIEELEEKIEKIENFIKEEVKKFPLNIEKYIDDEHYIKNQRKFYEEEISELEHIDNYYKNKVNMMEIKYGYKIDRTE